MMKTKNVLIPLVLLLAGGPILWAQDVPKTGPEASGFDRAAAGLEQRLKDSLAELHALRQQAKQEILPLSKKLSELESELVQVRREYQDASRIADTSALSLSTLDAEIKARTGQVSYLSNLLGEYVRNFEARLHIAEVQRYRESIGAAAGAARDSGRPQQEVYEVQTAVLGASLDRLEDALGGTRFEGNAVDSGGLVQPGTFVLIGPVALFQSKDAQHAGTVEQRLGSLEPSVVPFNDPADGEAAARVITDLAGRFPFDPTLGNAHIIESTEETLMEHIRKGGPVMVPILLLAGAALLAALYKWITLAFQRTPSRRHINALLDAVARHDEEDAMRKARAIKGPVGRMLTVGVAHLREPRELIEEVMYETVLATRLRLQRLLPFISISAASAPLLGLLGTVTGIINTFKLITVFGSGDVKTLSGGISEALITTEFGLIVAIPSLLLHAFLSRKARGMINEMEKAAVALVNQVAKTPFRHTDDGRRPETPSGTGERDQDAPMSSQVKEVLEGLIATTEEPEAQAEPGPP